jgi:hypothetical protein
MRRAWVTALVLAGGIFQTAAAQDAKAVIAAASKAMGADGLNSIYYDGVAQNGNLGQNNNSNQPWPLTGANDYVRAIDFTQPASRATWTTYAVPVTGGVATLAPAQQNITATDGLEARPGGGIRFAREVSWRKALPAGWVYQQPESGRTSSDVAGESGLW